MKLQTFADFFQMTSKDLIFSMKFNFTYFDI